MELKDIGITPAKIKQFNKKGLFTTEDLLRFFPRKYNDFSKINKELKVGDVCCLEVVFNNIYTNNGKVPSMTAVCKHVDTDATINVTWFRQNYMYDKLIYHTGKTMLVCGKLNYDENYKKYSIIMPAVFSPNIENDARIYPIYSKISGTSDEYLYAKIKQILDNSVIEEYLPEIIKEDYFLPDLDFSIKEIHNPKTMDRLNSALQRMEIEEILYFCAKMELNNRKAPKGTFVNIQNVKIFNDVVNHLPFQLTPTQDNAVRQMLSSLREGKRLNALLQGDTGSGKSIVAFLLMTLFAENKYQSVMMAPTQILATQHFDELYGMLKPFGINVALYCGSNMKASEKRAFYSDVKEGKIDIVIGTHSVLNESLEFSNLGLVITDEEHKFGCLQREQLVAKGSEGINVLNMSATPIPRSLAQILYGDFVQLYTIDKPSTRVLPITKVLDDMKTVYSLINREIKKGRQVYIVCPMIDESEDENKPASVNDVSKIYNDVFSHLGYKISTLTGKDSKEYANEVIADFKDGKTQILIATSIIEVGVSVPNATVMVIHDANYFGLSSIHQLRGRVMRNNEGVQPYCILLAKDITNERLKVLEELTDGFEIAKADLKIRHAGQLIDGVEQSGKNNYINLVLSNPDIYNYLKETVPEYIDKGYLDKFLEVKQNLIQ